MAAFPVNRRADATAVATGPPVPPFTPSIRPARPSVAPGPPRLRVTVTRSAPDAAGSSRWARDTEVLEPTAARRLRGLVDAVEAAGPPAGRPGSATTRSRPAVATAVYEVTVARGFGHWTVRVPDVAPPAPCPTALIALIDHVRGVPNAT
jgi:hypothetical protein